MWKSKAPQRLMRLCIHELLTTSKRQIQLSSRSLATMKMKKQRKKTCILLPGMGIEYPGMCKDIVNAFSYIRSFMTDCDDYLNMPLSQMMLDGPPEELSRPQNAGNAIFMATLCYWRILQQEYDIDRMLSDHDVTVIGHSMGEYVALELTQAYKSMEDALFISNLISAVCQRYSREDQGMYAIKCKAQYKLDLEWLSPFVKKHNLYFANLNAPNQVIISGLKQDIKCMEDEIGTDSYRESDGLRGGFISCQGAFHSPCLLPGLAELHDEWHSIELNNRLKYDMYLNVIGDKYEVTKGHNMTKIMQTQLYSQVKFYECIRNFMKRNGVENDDDDTQWNFVQIGPRNVLQKIMKDIAKYHRYDKEKKLNISSINSTKSIRDFESIL
eukprot:336888_1